MRHILLAALIPFAAAPAFAGNLAPAAPEAAPTPVFVETAPMYEWSGAYIGGQISYADISTDGAANLDDDGGLYGLRAGYDLQRGNQVFGGVLQYDIGSIDLEASGIELEDVLRVGGRYGITTGPALYYGTAGYARASTNIVGSTDGYFAGVGYERFVTDNVTFGAELLYHDFGDLDNAPGVDATATTVGLNLNYRF
ncbi:outer membrane immunogenic protein [Jannaschia faecimaris]|uniref:Outer membrane immunogenic protein n=1 Tax=Jannaschia faecimaris TaxID=1244108 RepID=A0A1H3RU14_9RHOB|nr:outer membrane beta-barrel protein [Jannaschia faecimaris]SDZ28808.1 outer membrane immunogenic protein [Jannaschia faecimaris]